MANFIKSKELCAPSRAAMALAGPSADLPPPVVAQDLAALPSAMDGVVLDGVLSAEESARLLAGAEESGGFGWWDPSGDTGAERRSVRNADTLEFDGDVAGLCDGLWRRLQPHVPALVEITPEQPRYERDLEGTWEAVGLNPHLLINRYAAGGHFAPHADGSTIVDFNHRSLCASTTTSARRTILVPTAPLSLPPSLPPSPSRYTVLLYLNDCPDGGATQILRAEQGEATTHDRHTGAKIATPESVEYAVAPRAGRTLMYWHEVVHAGEPVGKRCTKYCIRSDVMCARSAQLAPLLPSLVSRPHLRASEAQVPSRSAPVHRAQRPPRLQPLPAGPRARDRRRTDGGAAAADSRLQALARPAPCVPALAAAGVRTPAPPERPAGLERLETRS